MIIITESKKKGEIAEGFSLWGAWSLLPLECEIYSSKMGQFMLIYYYQMLTFYCILVFFIGGCGGSVFLKFLINKKVYIIYVSYFRILGLQKMFFFVLHFFKEKKY